MGKPTHIILFSIGRCGSTVVTQTLRYLFQGTRIITTHGYVPKHREHTVVLIYRDFRDVMTSYWRTEKNIAIRELEDGRMMQEEDVRRWLCVVKMLVGTLQRNSDKNPQAMLLAYEAFYGNRFEHLFMRIDRCFGRKITDEEKKHIRTHFSIQANAYAASRLKTFSDVGENGVHGLHVYRGQVGGWRYMVPGHLHKLVNRELCDELKRWGYKPDEI